MDISQKLAAERRARLVAERRLEHIQAELQQARDRIALQARALSDQLLEQRSGLEAALSEAASLKGEKHRALADLERANDTAQVFQRRLWTAMETMRDGFAIFDSGLKLVIANRSYIGFFLPTLRIKIGMTYSDILHECVESKLVDFEGLSPESWSDMMLKRVAEPSPKNVIVNTRDGRAFKMRNRRAEAGDLVSTVTNITHAIQREAELNEARLRAEAANRAKSAFLANMSHEIRTPMNGVVGMADLLCGSDLAEDQRLYAETIRSSGDALLAIINDILDMSKAEAGRLKLHPEPFDLHACMTEVVTLLQSTARDKAIHLLADYDEALPHRFIGDSQRLRQILTNLVGNAVKFTSTGHVVLRAAGHQTDDGWALSLMVEDSGIGIADEHQSMIFGEFDQVENETSRQYQGTGLGLAIAGQLANLMDGNISVISKLGEGAVFMLRLTLPPDPQAPPPVQRSRRADLQGAALFSPQPVQRQVLTEVLHHWGVPVRLVDSVDAAQTAGEQILIVNRLGPDSAGPTPPDSPDATWIPILNVDDTCSHQNPEGPSAAKPGRDHRPVFSPALLWDRLNTIDLTPQQPDPVEAVPPAPIIVQQKPPPASPPASAEQRIRILTADDNRTNLLVLRKMIESAGYDILAARDGQEAVQVWQENRPDLIFMDVSMPVLDGFEATRRIRRIEAREGWPRIPILALTAHPTEEIAPQIADSGADGCLPKPFRRGQILDAIESELRKTASPGPPPPHEMRPG